MRRIAAIVLIPLLAAAAVAVAARGDEGDDSYLVRAYFHNGSFMVPDEDVRIAGANVGSVESVEASLEDERVSREPGKEYQPGKAVVVMRIDDPGYREFLQDAYCLIRPQSLLGERYVNCRPTEPRGPGEEPAPPLERIPEGERGEGQYFLPIENTGKTVDTDLLNNIMRLPYRERLRLILNDLGAAFAGRGPDLRHIVENADPTLRDGNRVLGILAEQRKRLAQLSQDSQEILGPLARERGRVQGFFANAGTAAEATAARSADLEQAIAKFPGFLRELRSTMADFGDFSTAALPVAENLGIAAPSLTEGTAVLDRFAEVSEEALVSLGDAAEEAGPRFVESEPVVTKARNLAISGQRPTLNLSRFLVSLRETKGFEGLMNLIYYTTASMNGYDEFGHFMRTLVSPVNCFQYYPERDSACSAQFKSAVHPAPLRAARSKKSGKRGATDSNGAQSPLDVLLDVLDELGQGDGEDDEPDLPDPVEPEPQVPEPEPEPDEPEEPAGDVEQRAAEDLMRFMYEP